MFLSSLLGRKGKSKKAAPSSPATPVVPERPPFKENQLVDCWVTQSSVYSFDHETCEGYWRSGKIHKIFHPKEMGGDFKETRYYVVFDLDEVTRGVLVKELSLKPYRSQTNLEHCLKRFNQGCTAVPFAPIWAGPQTSVIDLTHEGLIVQGAKYETRKVTSVTFRRIEPKVVETTETEEMAESKDSGEDLEETEATESTALDELVETPPPAVESEVPVEPPVSEFVMREVTLEAPSYPGSEESFQERDLIRRWHFSSPRSTKKKFKSFGSSIGSESSEKVLEPVTRSESEPWRVLMVAGNMMMIKLEENDRSHPQWVRRSSCLYHYPGHGLDDSDGEDSEEEDPTPETTVDEGVVSSSMVSM